MHTKNENLQLVSRAGELQWTSFFLSFLFPFLQYKQFLHDDRHMIRKLLGRYSQSHPNHAVASRQWHVVCEGDGL